jgi:FAD/FMN-containing dehydrogenase
MTTPAQPGPGTSTLDTLISSFAGALIGPDDSSYDQARRALVWNGMHDRRPALIARCTSADDVRSALSYAQSKHLVVAVRGGGHSTPGYSSCDGGLVIDTGPIKHADIDVATSTGHFGAGLTWAEFDAATQEFGLAVTGGRVSHTGIAGLTLGSGSGWLERKYGMSCASLLSAEIVTANGRVLRASAEENADLLWGLKGGGGNFGVVTDLQFRLHPVGPIVYAGLILHPRDAAPALTRFYRDFMADAPDEVGGALAFITAPPADFVPEHVRGKPACGLIVIYVGDPDQGEVASRPLLNWGEPWLTMVQPMPYTAVQQFLDPGYPWGILDYSKNDYLSTLPDDAIDEMVRRAGQARSPLSAVILCPLGGQMSRVDRDSMALNIPDTSWMYFCEATSFDAAVQEHEIEWARGFMTAMRPWSVDQAPPNFLEPDEGITRLRRSYGEDKYRKLVALKDTYDPRNVFTLNGNIHPSVPAPRSA